jgi:hypothetical protein
MQSFTESDLNRAVIDLSMLQFFPTDPGTQSSVMTLLRKMCPHREALQWLVNTMVNHVGKWYGPVELRGVLCWKYRPADGISANCSVAGFTPDDGEEISLERHKQLKAGGWVGDERKPSELTRCDGIIRGLLNGNGKS